MAYSKLGIVNMALGRIGQNKIASLTEGSQAAIQAEGSQVAIQANVVWEFLRDEVLEAADWTFAKTRIVLSKNATTPVDRYEFAYTLPSDFLRLCRSRKCDPPVSPANVSPNTEIFGRLDYENTKYGYVIETLDDGTECLFTSFDNVSEDLVIQYIRKEDNPARYTAHFASTLAYRLAADLSVVITEDTKKHDSMITLYDASLKRAKAHNMSGDYLPDETGNDDWEYAGRG